MKLLIRENHIKKIWIWVWRCGFLLALGGIILLFEEIEITPPFRHQLSNTTLRWTERGIYAVSVLSVMASLSVGAGKKKKEFEKHAKKIIPQRERHPTTALKKEDALLLLEYLRRIESLQWNTASIPGLVGIIFYFFAGFPAWMLICLSISVVTFLLHRPSLERDEELVTLFAGTSTE